MSPLFVTWNQLREEGSVSEDNHTLKVWAKRCVTSPLSITWTLLKEEKMCWLWSIFDSTGFFTELMGQLFDTKHFVEDRYEITWKQLREGSMTPLLLTWVNICLHWLLLLSRVQGSSPCPTMFTLQHLRTVMDKNPFETNRLIGTLGRTKEPGGESEHCKTWINITLKPNYWLQ